MGWRPEVFGPPSGCNCGPVNLRVATVGRQTFGLNLWAAKKWKEFTKDGLASFDVLHRVASNRLPNFLNRSEDSNLEFSFRLRCKHCLLNNQTFNWPNLLKFWGSMQIHQFECHLKKRVSVWNFYFLIVLKLFAVSESTWWTTFKVCSSNGEIQSIEF